ncbi:hypothetical protein BZG36_02206 [Bifiguratus adelaidae]|uniref:ubiquitinyl hydrolase 1 n=1 Tax=Bifiguratus adelaidae TaxID=1938954 RepID=A0A261Y3N4_9FUNG|nr:hypothetical protein BZG36_02206 [Bifiguratus adelaidae]
MFAQLPPTYVHSPYTSGIPKSEKQEKDVGEVVAGITPFTTPKTPASWLNWLGIQCVGQTPHQHQFVVEQAPKQQGGTPGLIVLDADDKENAAPTSAPSESEEQRVTVLCRVCHRWCTITADASQVQRSCTLPDSPAHHFHSSKPFSSQFTCCTCHLVISFSFVAPAIPLVMLNNLISHRPVQSTIDLTPAEGKIPKPSIFSTLETLLKYVDNVVNGERRDIKVQSSHFQRRIGWDDYSKAIFKQCGFVLTDNHLSSTPFTESHNALERLKRCRTELHMHLSYVRQKHNIEGFPVDPEDFNIVSATDALNEITGNFYIPRDSPNMNTKGLPDAPAYSELGTVPAHQDTMHIWAYRKLASEQPRRRPQLMDALTDLAKNRRSAELETEVAIERSQGVVGKQDIVKAYEYFDIPVTEENGVLKTAGGGMTDQTIIGLFNLKSNDSPSQLQEHREQLLIIANSRESKVLHQFLEDGTIPHEFEPSGDLDEHNATQAAVAGIGNHSSTVTQPNIDPAWSMPVGLDNIGNTCYLNSLLQYYYTVRPLRDSVLSIRALDESRPSSPLPRKIGGRSVETSEIIRSHKFVRQLKVLFDELMHSDYRSVRPEYELAYLALTNSTDDEHAQTKQPSEVAAQSTLAPPVPAPAPAVEGPLPHAITTIPDKIQTIDEDETGPSTSESNTMSSDTPAPDVKEVDAPMEATTDTLDAEFPPPYETATEAPDERVLLSPPSAGPAVPPRPVPPTPTDVAAKSVPQDPSNMLFGSQQDVTECMDRVMFSFEATLRPSHDGKGATEEIDDSKSMIQSLFYGKNRQILTYEDTETGKVVSNSQEEEFSHLIVDAAEGKDLYDGLDEYFYATDLGEDFRGGKKATREVVAVELPPILQIQVQRAKYDRATQNVYKSNAFLKLEKSIFLDRYLASNHEGLADRRKEVEAMKTQREKCQNIIQQYVTNNNYPMPVADMLEAAIDILRLDKEENEGVNEEDFIMITNILRKESEWVKRNIEESTSQLETLNKKIRGQYEDLRSCKYRLQAVFVHQGQVNYGHYWIYIYDFKDSKWLKYNDSNVTHVEEAEVFADTTGSTANPYFLVYVKATEAEDLIDTVRREKRVKPEEPQRRASEPRRERERTSSTSSKKSLTELIASPKALDMFPYTMRM